MPVTIYRRHLPTCPHKTKGRAFDRCGCPYWVDPRPVGKLRSLGTKDRSKALAMARDMELSGGGIPSHETVEGPVTITAAKDHFLESLRFQGLAKATILKHQTLWRQCTAFAATNGIELVQDLDGAAVAKFMKTWADGVPGKDGEAGKKPEGANARGKKLERFRQFFKFAIARKWIEDDPTKGIKGPKVKLAQTLPFTPNEMTKILVEAEARISTARSAKQKANNLRAKALILFLRFSGLRIGDAVSCKIEWVKDGRVRRRTQKNGRHIDVELPSNVIHALKTVPPLSDLYYFWTGECTIKTATSKWQFRLLKIFRAAGIQNGHPHRFRDTFAVAMLERGESLQAVADALGNTLEVTEKHYNPWSKTRQSRLDEAVRATWKGDPLLKILDEQQAAEKAATRRIN